MCIKDIYLKCKNKLSRDLPEECEALVNRSAQVYQTMGREGEVAAAETLRKFLSAESHPAYIHIKGRVNSSLEALTNLRFLDRATITRFTYPQLKSESNKNLYTIINIAEALRLSMDKRPHKIISDFTHLCKHYFTSESLSKLIHQGMINLLNPLLAYHNKTQTTGYPLVVPAELLFSRVDLGFGQVIFQPGRHATITLESKTVISELREEYALEKHDEKKRELMRREFNPPFKIHIMCHPDYHLWVFLRLIVDIRYRLKERLNEATLDTDENKDTEGSLQDIIDGLSRKIKKIQKRLKRGQRSAGKNLEHLFWKKYILLEKLHYTQGRAFPWDKYIDMGKTGFLYRNTLYQGGWGYPRQDPFPSIVLYPLQDTYLLPLIIHLEKLFPRRIRRKVSIPYFPFSNIRINAMTYVSYGGTESRQRAFRYREPGWHQSNISKKLRLHDKTKKKKHYNTDIHSDWELPNNQRCNFVSKLLEQRFHYLA